MDKVRVAVVGIGNIGSAHAKSIADGNIAHMELVAVCDVDSTKLDWAKANLNEGVAQFADYGTMLHELQSRADAVLVATPHYDHPPMAMAAMQQGYHVLCEKPAGVYTKQVQEMNHLAQQSGKVFSLMYNQRTNPLYSKVRDMVQSGALGVPKRLVWIITNWYRKQSYYESSAWRATWRGEGGGVLLNQCPHNLDLWQWIFGMPTRVHGFVHYGKYHDIEVDDDVTAYAEYANGATATFITTTGEAPGTNRLEVVGDRGKVVIENGTMMFHELATAERTYCYSDDTEEFPQVSVSEIRVDAVETAHNGILQNFTNAILFGEPLIAPGVEGIHGLTLSNAMHLSSWLGKTIDLPLDEDLYYAELQKRIACSTAKNCTPKTTPSIQGTYSERWQVR